MLCQSQNVSVAMESIAAVTPQVPAEEKELVNDCSGPSSGRFIAAYGEEVVGLDLLPPGRPSAQHPVVPANFLLCSDGLLEVVWI